MEGVAFEPNIYSHPGALRLKDVQIRPTEVPLFLSFVRVSRFRKPAENEIVFANVKGIPSFAEFKDVGRMPAEKRLRFELFLLKRQKLKALKILARFKRDLLYRQEFLKREIADGAAMGHYTPDQIRKWEK